jgi:hypothetical protein
VLGKCRRLQKCVCGVQGPPKMRQRHQNLEKCNFVTCDTVHIGSCIFVFGEESGMSFRRDDCTGTKASVSVLWSDVRGDAARD